MEELIPALGCTEPVCAVYAAAKAAECLGGMPDHLVVEGSGNIIKNVKGAVVPNSSGLNGIETAAVLGAVGRNPDLKMEDVQELIERQIEYNEMIAQEGKPTVYGASVGANLVKYYGNDIRVRTCTMAAAGNDAKMSGCLYPVVINSGSGNQGITVLVPVIEYAKEMETGHGCGDNGLLSVSGEGSVSAWGGDREIYGREYH